jgi:hypothetical protein
MKTYCGGGIAPRILDRGTNGGKWSASCPGSFTPGETALGTLWIGGWVGPRASLNAVEKRKISSPYRESNLGRPGRSIVSTFTELPWLFNLTKQLTCVSVCVHIYVAVEMRNQVKPVSIRKHWLLADYPVVARTTATCLQILMSWFFLFNWFYLSLIHVEFMSQFVEEFLLYNVR